MIGRLVFSKVGDAVYVHVPLPVEAEFDTMFLASSGPLVTFDSTDVLRINCANGTVTYKITVRRDGRMVGVLTTPASG